MNRIVLLGASNLTLSFCRLVDGLGQALESPVEIRAAHGHGRSYGEWSCVFGRALPGIADCRLWEDLDRVPAADSTRALVTDIGNDILFGAEVERVLGWVRECLDRLQAQGARTVMTSLPMASLANLSRARFLCARSCFFPQSRLTLPDVQRLAEELEAGIIALGEREGVTLVEPEGDWYGLDPIHIRPGRKNVAWQSIFEEWWDEQGVPAFPRVRIHRAIEAWRWRPAERAWRGCLELAGQPIYRDNGTSVWLY